jgi:hypothetical protein
MKAALQSLALIALGSSLCAATSRPELQHDPDTVKDCIDWYNNINGRTCQETRTLFNISPEQFAAWNPSVGVDCHMWIWASYCVMTQEKLNSLTSASTATASSTASTTSTSSSTIGPSPTAWEDLGCYADRPNRPILEKMVNGDGGDPALTTAKCQDTCYRLNFSFSGVKAGNECWCSGFVAGEWTANVTDCNMACTSDKTKICGGKDCLNVFKASRSDVLWQSSTSIDAATETPTPATASGQVAQMTRPNSGAMRNMAWF